MKIKYFHKTFILIWKYNKYWLLLSLLFKVLLGLYPLATLWLTKTLVDQVSQYIQGAMGKIETIILLLITQFILLILQSIVQQSNLIIDASAEINIDYQIGKLIANKTISVPLEYFELPEFHNHRNRINGNHGNRLMSPINNFFDIIQSVVSLCSYLSFLWLIHWGLVVLSMISAIPILFMQSKYGNQKFLTLKFNTPEIREANYYNVLLNNRQSAQEIRLFNLGQHLLDRWGILFLSNNKRMLRIIRKEKISLMVLDALSAVFYCIAAMLLISLLKVGKVSIGGFITTIQGIQGAQASVNTISMNIARIYEQNLYIEDLFLFLEFDSNTNDNYLVEKSDILLKEPLKEIEVKNLYYSYPNSNDYVLKNINLSIKSGERIAIVGENGSGKTTLIKCLMGLYKPNKGQILYDKIDIKKIPSRQLYKNVTAIFQDFMRYSLSVRDNITFGDISNAENDILLREVSKVSGVANVIEKFKYSYSTKLGKLFKNSEDLSGGQWQKIAIARALFSKAQIIFLDEPTSSLDPETELKVFKSFHKITQEKTSIYISHRMSSTKIADRVFVIKHGELIEMGSHEQLMKLKGEYFNMYNAQAQMF